MLYMLEVRVARETATNQSVSPCELKAEGFKLPPTHFHQSRPDIKRWVKGSWGSFWGGDGRV